VFGDAIAPRGGAVTLGSLIRLAAPFGLTERLVRTSVARLARAGWLAARRSGRRSEYRLTPGGARRFAAATHRIYGASPQDWDRLWTLALLPARQARLREELEWLGFGALNGTLLAHPIYTPAQVRRWLRRGASARVLLLRARNDDLGADRRLAGRGWDLKDLAQRYRRFVAAFAPVETALARAAPAPATAFLVRTLLIHEYRKIHLRDPLLPPPLLPPRWVGSAAYELCARLYGRVFAAAEEHLGGTAHRLHRALPPAGAGAPERFGGLTPP
jgi:phenylacetic acid degradation operon negative regulatory protein